MYLHEFLRVTKDQHLSTKMLKIVLRNETLSIWIQSITTAWLRFKQPDIAVTKSRVNDGWKLIVYSVRMLSQRSSLWLIFFEFLKQRHVTVMPWETRAVHATPYNTILEQIQIYVCSKAYPPGYFLLVLFFLCFIFPLWTPREIKPSDLWTWVCVCV